MIKPDAKQRPDRGKTGNVATEFIVIFVGAHHHGQGIPATYRANPFLHGSVTRRTFLHVRRDGVDIGGVGAVRHRRTGTSRFVG